MTCVKWARAWRGVWSSSAMARIRGLQCLHSSCLVHRPPTMAGSCAWYASAARGLRPPPAPPPTPSSPATCVVEAITLNAIHHQLKLGFMVFHHYFLLYYDGSSKSDYLHEFNNFPGASWHCKRCVDQRYRVAAAENRASKRSDLFRFKGGQQRRQQETPPCDVSLLPFQLAFDSVDGVTM